MKKSTCFFKAFQNKDLRKIKFGNLAADALVDRSAIDEGVDPDSMHEIAPGEALGRMRPGLNPPGFIR